MKVYAYVFIVAAIIGAAWTLIELGKALERAKYEQKLVQYREEESDLLAKLADKDKQREVIYRDKIKIVERTVNECLDSDVPDDVLRVLPAGSGKTQ